MTHTFSKWVALAGFLTLSACGGLSTGSKYEPGPVGVGPGVQDLKGTPCACTEIPMNYPAGYGPSVGML